jgi:hypothetical protein
MSGVNTEVSLLLLQPAIVTVSGSIKVSEINARRDLVVLIEYLREMKSVALRLQKLE